MTKLNGFVRWGFHWIFGMVTAIGAVGLLGATGRAEARVAQDRAMLEARVELLRLTAKTIDSSAAVKPETTLAQWLNWPNFRNWNNWGNWFNR